MHLRSSHDQRSTSSLLRRFIESALNATPSPLRRTALSDKALLLSISASSSPVVFFFFYLGDNCAIGWILVWRLGAYAGRNIFLEASRGKEEGKVENGERNQPGLHEPPHETNATSQRGRAGREEGHNAEHASIYLLKTSYLVLEKKERNPIVRQTDEGGGREGVLCPWLSLPACLHIDTYPFSINTSMRFKLPTLFVQ